MFTTLASSASGSSLFDPTQYLNKRGQLNGWTRDGGVSAIDWNGGQVMPVVNPIFGNVTGYSFRKPDPSSPTGWSSAEWKGNPSGQIDTNSLQWNPYDNSDGWGTKLLNAGAIAGAGALLAPIAGAAFGAAPGAVMGNGAFLGEGIASGVPAWDAAAGLSAAGSAAGSGAFLGEGAASGVPAWDAGMSAAGGAGSTGGSLLGKKTINSFGLGDALNLGGNLLNSYLGYNASNKAADAQVNAANQSNALAKYMYDQTRQDNMPALEARNAGLTGYQNLLKDPSSVTQDPGYQFGFNQGMNAYDNSGAARGMRLSGAQAKALTRYGQDYAGTKYNEALGRYGQLAGIGQPGANTIAGAGQNYSNQFGQNTTGAGNAAASGYIGGANAISGGISNFLRNWQESNLLKQLGIGG